MVWLRASPQAMLPGAVLLRASLHLVCFGATSLFGTVCRCKILQATVRRVVWLHVNPHAMLNVEVWWRENLLAMLPPVCPCGDLLAPPPVEVSLLATPQAILRVMAFPRAWRRPTVLEMVWLRIALQASLPVELRLRANLHVMLPGMVWPLVNLQATLLAVSRRLSLQAMVLRAVLLQATSQANVPGASPRTSLQAMHPRAASLRVSPRATPLGKLWLHANTQQMLPGAVKLLLQRVKQILLQLDVPQQLI